MRAKGGKTQDAQGLGGPCSLYAPSPGTQQGPLASKASSGRALCLPLQQAEGAKPALCVPVRLCRAGRVSLLVAWSEVDAECGAGGGGGAAPGGRAWSRPAPTPAGLLHDTQRTDVPRTPGKATQERQQSRASCASETDAVVWGVVASSRGCWGEGGY